MTAGQVPVLYVDDDRINTFLFVETCKAIPHLAVATAADGAEALEVCRQVRPRVLVIDMNLPDTNGLVLLQRLRAEPDMTDTPAFLCTAEMLSDVQAPAAAAGFAGCWCKPVSAPEIQADLARAGIGA